MPKSNLTPEDKAKLIESINNGTEPNADLLPKLFPGTAEKFDVHALDRAKIPTLEYAGKRSKAAILAEAGAGIGAAPLQTVRCFGEIKKNEWRNLIVQGDNLQFLKTCYNNTDPLTKDKVKGKVKLIYIDPPFASLQDFKGKEGEKSYSDKVATAEFIEALRERLVYLWGLLHNNGSIFIHLDYRAIHYVKVVCDEIFGKQHLINEIIYGYRIQGISSSSYARKHQTILWYSRDSYYPKLEKERIWYEKSFRDTAYIEPASLDNRDKDKIIQQINSDIPVDDRYKEKLFKKYYSDVRVRDVWDSDRTKPFISGSKEYLNYRTQKSEGLLHRIIENHTDKDDLVIDLFAGSGTTVAVAEKLGRRWIACDFGKHAIYTMQRRLLRINESKALIDAQDKIGKVIVKKGDPYKKNPEPFCIISSGAYDFSHIMDLRKHKDAYVDFVLGLFQLARNEEKAKKYKLANIYTAKDNNPVEVYPVWDDEFLKEVKIDEPYLQGIINQSGGKLKGEYYIITPESCTNISDTIIKNQDGKDVHFLIKTFPYKVLEDISRNLRLQEQPSSQDNVNNLITSTAFYFNENVNFFASRTKGGLKIVRFESKILNKEGNRFEGFSGLAMLLVDLDYEPNKPFDMDKTVFAKDIEEDGSVEISLTKSVGLIAIDKHGNESKPFNLE